MIKRFGLMVMIGCAWVLTACDANAGRPRLVAENTLDPAQVAQLPTLIQLPPTPFPTSAATSEVMSPVQMITLPADFVIVTPTFPPSKTPSITPTITTTPTISPTPTITVTSSATAPTFPTPVFTPTQAVVSNPINQVCLTQWQYIQPPPPGCPIYPATVGRGVYQEFERGFMFWLPPAEIYVLYNDGVQPYWTRFDDTFIEGTGNFPNSPWKDPYYDTIAPPGRYQPVRGFGKLWRNEDQNPQKAVVQGRVGWGIMQNEQPYSAMKQTREDGTIFISDPNGRVFQLIPAGVWQIYAGLSSPFTNNNTGNLGGGSVNVPLPPP